MASRIGESGGDGSRYSQQRRFAHLFRAALKNPVPPSLVAEKIGEIVESGTWQLRHPVGPDALQFLGWRNSMTDEEWVELHGGRRRYLVPAHGARLRFGYPSQELRSSFASKTSLTTLSMCWPVLNS